MLTSRQISIFKAIVEEFIQTADPIGSNALMHKYKLPYSSATIRNEMMELENIGLLEKTHTSSGRVPSINGYMFYAEHLMSDSNDEVIKNEIAQIFDFDYDLQDAIRKSCEVLSQMTSLTAVVLGPDANKQRLEHIKLFPINERSAVAIFITDTGHTEDRVFKFDSDVSLNDLQSCTDILNERLKGTLISDVVVKMESLKPILAGSIARYETLFKAFLNAFARFASENIYCSGQNNLMYQPEFANLDRLRNMMKMLETNEWFEDFTNSENQLAVKMNENTDLIWRDDMAVVCSRFKVSDTQEGEIFILGPNRMEYNRVVSMIDAMGEMLEKMYRKR